MPGTVYHTVLRQPGTNVVYSEKKVCLGHNGHNSIKRNVYRALNLLKYTKRYISFLLLQSHVWAPAIFLIGLKRFYLPIRFFFILGFT